jgi:hypothetical protein
MKTILKSLTMGAGILAGVTLAPTRSEAGGLSFLSAAWSDGHTAIRVNFNTCPPPPPPRCEPPRRWIPGHYEVRRERICIPGYWREVVTPAEYAWVRHGCRSVYVQVRPACTQRVWVPECVEWRETKVWVPGRYEVAGSAVAHR